METLWTDWWPPADPPTFFVLLATCFAVIAFTYRAWRLWDSAETPVIVGHVAQDYLILANCGRGVALNVVATGKALPNELEQISGIAAGAQGRFLLASSPMVGATIHVYYRNLSGRWHHSELVATRQTSTGGPMSVTFSRRVQRWRVPKKVRRSASRVAAREFVQRDP
ncbi:MAG: hypothetical protein GEU99_06740 [Luteitalea sp.]|nr:hypothetical protein [Luteitalea sp.]